MTIQSEENENIIYTKITVNSHESRHKKYIFFLKHHLGAEFTDEERQDSKRENKHVH